MRKDKICLLDFCGTVVPFQTANAYVGYLLDKHPELRNRCNASFTRFLNVTKITSVIRRLYPSYYIDKRLLLSQTKGMSEKVMTDTAKLFYQERVKPQVIPEVMEYLQQLKKQGYEICLLSGGYDLYLRFFCEDYNIPRKICSQIEFNKGVSSGCIKGLDCMNKNKPVLLQQSFGKDIDMSQWYFLSDSPTDKPVLDLVGHPVVVSENESAGWAEQLKYKQIIYKS